MKQAYSRHSRRDRLHSIESWKRPVIFCAHPDDETIGAAGVLLRNPTAYVVYLTDGAPRDSAFWPARYKSREDYALVRRREAESALSVAGVMPDRLISLGGIDQEASHEILAYASYFVSLLRRIAPDVLIAHPYEGGHPDHDATALIASMAARRLTSGKPELLEMASYHGFQGKLVTGKFLGAEKPSLVVELSAIEIEQKQKMLAAYQSQGEVLRSFQVGNEALRTAPAYSFNEPPHPGQLWYEQLGWRISSRHWRSLALAALHEMDRICA